jgi:acetaldehyde dehydrogenase (acetylating)
MDQDLLALQEVRDLVQKAKKAQAILETYSQEEVDKLVSLMAEQGFRASRELAEIACEETGYGKVESKLLKNQFATRNVYEYLKNLKTVGIIKVDQEKQIYEIASPMGIVAGIVPVTNPTSTALFKILICIKARCTIVLSPHPKAVRCVQATVKTMLKALESVGAPDGIISSLVMPTLASTQELMKHHDVDVILATGGSGLVKAAYSSGKPAIGVGPGNVPVFIDRSADIPHAVRCLVASKSFDWGTICSSEQALVIDKPVEKQVLAEFQRQGAYLCNDKETQAFEALMPPGSLPNSEMVGKSPTVIANMAGFKVPNDTQLLLVWQKGVGEKYPLSREKLNPTLALYVEDGWEAGARKCLEIIRYGGEGHTAVIHGKNQEVISAFAMKMPASRILVNAPSSQGGVGYATGLIPSMTLGCGTSGGNITADNINSLNLLNIKRVAFGNLSWFADLPTPQTGLSLVPQATNRHANNPFDNVPKSGKKYFVGPYNDPNI